MDLVRLGMVALVAVALMGCEDKGPWDGPFGTKKGLTKEQLEQFAVLTELDPGSDSKVRIYDSPQAPDIELGGTYTYIVGKDKGLCLVIGFQVPAGKSIEYFKSRYGAPEKHYELIDDDGRALEEFGSIWSERTHKLGQGLHEVKIYSNRPEPDSTPVVKVSYIPESDCR